LQAGSPEFKDQSHKKIKKEGWMDGERRTEVNCRNQGIAQNLL
jgi:hypothetical protein